MSLLTLQPSEVTESLYRDMETSGRLFFLELGCSEDSVLRTEVENVGLTAKRASLFNQHDLTCPHGLRKILNIVTHEKPKHVWISTECSAFSPMQNLNQRTPQQVRDLQQKQREARKQHIAGLVMAYWARHQGAHVYWERSRKCRAWNWDLMDKWRKQEQTHTAIVGGCRVGLQDPKTGAVVGKEWRVVCTSKTFAEKFHLPCLREACAGNHTACEGHVTRASAFYTRKLAKRAVHYMQQNQNPEPVPTCLNMHECQCDVFKFKGQTQTCPTCMLQWDRESAVHCGHVDSPVHDRHVADSHVHHKHVQDLRSDAIPRLVGEVSNEGEFSEQEKKKWLHKIGLLHSATGHGSKEVLQEALKLRKVDPRIINLVGEYRCSICEERKRPAPRSVATLEVHPARWKIVLADGAYWVHPGSGVRHIMGLYMDQCSRYMVGKTLIQHKTDLPDAQSYMKFFTEQWQQYFGRPETLRFDAEGTWRSKMLDQLFRDLRVMMDPIPGDAHWHLSPLERAIAWIKECLSKFASENPKVDSHVALGCDIEDWNNRDVVRGYSPRQHALGQAPDPCGRIIFETPIQGLPVHMMGNPESEVHQHQRLRVEAEVTFLRWQAQQRLNRAANSRHKQIPEFAPGDLV